jgi:hypothetical protein
LNSNGKICQIKSSNPATKLTDSNTKLKESNKICFLNKNMIHPEKFSANTEDIKSSDLRGGPTGGPGPDTIPSTKHRICVIPPSIPRSVQPCQIKSSNPANPVTELKDFNTKLNDSSTKLNDSNTKIKNSNTKSNDSNKICVIPPSIPRSVQPS